MGAETPSETSLPGENSMSSKQEPGSVDLIGISILDEVSRGSGYNEPSTSANKTQSGLGRRSVSRVKVDISSYSNAILFFATADIICIQKIQLATGEEQHVLNTISSLSGEEEVGFSNHV
jgi:hypothetical protein